MNFNVLTPYVLGECVKDLKILLFGMCQVGPMTGAPLHLNYKISHMLMGSYRHSEVPAIDIDQFDAAVIALTLDHIIEDATGHTFGGLHTYFETEVEFHDFLDRCESLMNEKISSLHQCLGKIPAFFVSFFEPSFDYMGNLTEKYSFRSNKYIIRKINESLYNLIRSCPNCYFVDSNDILNFVGRAQLQDDIISYSTHASFLGDVDLEENRRRLVPAKVISETFEVKKHEEFYGHIFWNVMEANLKILRQSDSVKLIIVDLDDTLWKGVAAESDDDPVGRARGWPQGFVEALLYFKRRGGLLAICSKNEREVTLERFGRIWLGAITVDDFASIKINRRPKSENIVEIIEETNILPGNILFVDDDPREVNEVKSRFPAIRSLCENCLDWRRIILRSPETQVPFVTEESVRRTELVRARVERESLAKTMPREEWLASLEIEQSFVLLHEADSSRFMRVLELVNKTNQFNTTGRRWTDSELREFLQSGGECLVASLRDKTVDNGIVGAALVRTGEIVQCVLSCRIFGLGAETAMGRWATLIALRQSDCATASIVDTGKNFTCHNYFESLGFERREEGFFTKKACTPPPWIKVIDQALP